MSAPSSRTRSSFASLPAIATTRHPAARAIWTAAVPTPRPAGEMAIVSPGRGRPRTMRATQAVMKFTGKAAASTEESPGTTGNAWASGTTTSSA